MKILNLYAGIGGNRKLWGDDHEITAVEYKQEIADIYHDFFPKDKIVVADAHQYLLDHFREYDFIWSSPPCPTHSDIRRCGVHAGRYKALYPEMELYQEIILLKHFAPKDTIWVVENVNPYYEPLIKAQKINRHLFWSNMFIPEIDFKEDRRHNNIIGSSTVYGFNLVKYKADNKRKLLRNMVNPKVGKYLLDLAINPIKQDKLL